MKSFQYKAINSGLVLKALLKITDRVCEISKSLMISNFQKINQGLTFFIC
ncbi:MAG: hypothetical protein PHY93_19490 [Bacteriovorax sp.]|nr:hypothetical protein [Bacteriovorax sp.]